MKKRSLLQRWWFWVLIIVVIVTVFGKRGGQRSTQTVQRQAETVATAKPAATARPTASPKPIPIAPPTATPKPSAAPVPEASAAPVPETDKAPQGVSPEFKTTMDSYEAFFDEYVAFLKAMSDDPTNVSMLLRYSTMVMQYADTMEKLDAIDESRLSPADDAYYIEVMARIEVKLLEAARYMQ